MTWGALAEAVTRPVAPTPVTLTEPMTGAERIRAIVTDAQLLRVTKHVGLQVPAMRSGHTQITKKPGTWPLRMWVGDRLAKYQPAWLENPDPRSTFAQLIAETLDDAIWHDRAYWRVTRRGADMYPLSFVRIPAEQVTEDEKGIYVQGVPASKLPDTPGPVIFTDGRVLESVIPMHWSGLGGLNGAGRVVVDLALSLLATATSMAKVPLPQAVLEAEAGSAEMTQTEIDELLDSWDLKRQTRSTAFLQKLKLHEVSFNAKELQLVEGREHSALEVARALSLPASAVQASNGASLEYSTTVENRRELVEAVRMWTAPLEQALALHAAPRGLSTRFDVTSYLRDDPSTRMTTWATALASGILTLDEVRSQEPLATGGTP